MSILITGALGATGKVLNSYLSLHKKCIDFVNVDIKEISHANYIKCDLSDKNQVVDLLDTLKPDQIYHLAGSFSNDFEFDFKNNVFSTQNILNAIVLLNLKSKVLLIGSSAEYGFVEEHENPINEKHELNPCSIYGLTKVYQTQLMKYYYNMFGLNVTIARTFNLFGEGISEKLFIGNLYYQIAKLKRNEINTIQLGNLNHKRDYISIEEAVKKYFIIMEKGIPGEIYNVGSGKSVTIKTILEKVLNENNISPDCIKVNLSSTVNKSDIKDIYADNRKFNGLTE